MSKSTRAAIYARVSTSGQDLETQLLPLRAHVRERGWEGQEFEDVCSRARRRRPGLDSLLATVRRRKIDVVVVAALDRLAGSLPQLVLLLDELDALGVAVVALREGVDSTTVLGRVMLQLNAVFAQLERERTRERIQAGLDRARAQGKTLGRPRREFNVERARELLAAGKSQREAAAATGVSRGVLRRALGRAENPA